MHARTQEFAAVSCFFFRRPRAAVATLLLGFGGLVPLVLKSHATGGAGHAGSLAAVTLGVVAT
jgi:hypothetical protein